MMTACLYVSLFIGRGVLDEHACSCVAQCNAFRAGQRRAVWVAQQHAHAGLAAKRRVRITGTKLICVRSSLSCSLQTQGGASSSAGCDAAIILPSKSSKLVPVNPRNEIRRTCNNLAIALSFRCRYRAASPASGNYQRDKMTSLKFSLACNSTLTTCGCPCTYVIRDINWSSMPASFPSRTHRGNQGRRTRTTR